MLISYDYDEFDFHDQLSSETRSVNTAMLDYGRGQVKTIVLVEQKSDTYHNIIVSPVNI